MDYDDTIFAVASGAGRAALAIMRISGTKTAEMLATLTRRSLPQAKRASVRRLRDRSGTALDQAIVLWLPGPGSYTGEDSAELHLHGGPAVLDGVAAALVELGARPAEPGAFSRRAFLNGRMDLTEIEAVADLVAAETEAQRRQALRQLDGELGRVFEDWGIRLKAVLAREEALIDFPDETAGTDAGLASLMALRAEIAAYINATHQGERLRNGLRIAVSGPPNVGKSSLINVLAGRSAAIVAPTAGTTRDVIEVATVLGGVPVVLLDTAGLRDTNDPVEAEGVRRAYESAATADLVIAVHQAGAAAGPVPAGAILVMSKIDLAEPVPGALGTSTMTGAGIEALRDRLDFEARRLTQASGPPPLTRVRHRAACLDAVARLDDAIQAPDGELRAEELRLAMRALGRVTGRVDVEAVLDVVFSQFCIGK